MGRNRRMSKANEVDEELLVLSAIYYIINSDCLTDTPLSIFRYNSNTMVSVLKTWENKQFFGDFSRKKFQLYHFKRSQRTSECLSYVQHRNHCWILRAKTLDRLLKQNLKTAFDKMTPSKKQLQFRCCDTFGYNTQLSYKKYCKTFRRHF